MKPTVNMNKLSLALVATMLSGLTLNHIRADDDVSSILKQIDNSSSSKTNGENASPKKNSTSNVISKKKRPVESSTPSIKVWNPQDKLPKDVTGQGVAGNFAIQGSSSEGTLILVPAEDADNPFARQYWVVNRTYAGGSPNVLVPIGQRQLVQVTLKQPLIFIGRGILPGVYNVQIP